MRRPKVVLSVIGLCAGLIAGGMPSANAALAAPYYFEDHFLGTQLNPAWWDPHTNNDGTLTTGNRIDVSGSWVQLTDGHGLDAPYVHTAVGFSPFPATGNIALEVRFRYPQLAVKGMGLVVLDGAHRALGGFWGDSMSGLSAGVGGVRRSLPGDPAQPHVLRWVSSGTHGQVSMYYDGQLLATATLASRPVSLWFGHPTIGEELAAGVGSCVDATGTVTCRWWSSGDWTDLSLDYIRVSTVPLPEALWLFGSGLLGMAAVGRRRRR